MEIIGRDVGRFLPDIAGGDLLIIRRSDITPQEFPPNPTREQAQEAFKVFNTHVDSYLERNGIAPADWGEERRRGIFSRLVNDEYSSATNNLTKDGKPLSVITIPDQAVDAQRVKRDALAFAQNNSLNLDPSYVPDPKTTQAFLLAHEAGHVAFDTTSDKHTTLEGETGADRIAEHAVRNMKDNGVAGIDMRTVDYMKDMRTLATLYGSSTPGQLYGKVVHEGFDEATHDTGVLLKRGSLPATTFQAESAAMKDAENEINTFLGGRYRSQYDGIAANIPEEDRTTAANYNRNWDPKNHEDVNSDQYGQMKDSVGKVVNTYHPDELNYTAPTFDDLMMVGDTKGKAVLGDAIAQEYPDIHYATAKSLYDNDNFTGLKKEYVGDFLEAYEKRVKPSPATQALVTKMTADVKSASEYTEDKPGAEVTAPASKTDVPPPSPQSQSSAPSAPHS